MTSELLYGIPLWILFLAFVGLLLALVETGYRLGRRQPTDDQERSQVGVIQGALLALLGLLLGFSFSMAATRFEARKQLVLDEANAIGTAYLRAQLLPERQRDQVLSLLRRYV